MGNKFGNFASVEAAEAAIVAEGYAKNERGLFAKRGRTGGNLIAAPLRATSLVEITSYRVDGQYAADGRDYRVFQHHFVA